MFLQFVVSLRVNLFPVDLIVVWLVFQTVHHLRVSYVDGILQTKFGTFYYIFSINGTYLSLDWNFIFPIVIEHQMTQIHFILLRNDDQVHNSQQISIIFLFKNAESCQLSRKYNFVSLIIQNASY